MIVKQQRPRDLGKITGQSPQTRSMCTISMTIFSVRSDMALNFDPDNLGIYIDDQEKKKKNSLEFVKFC